MKKSTMLFLILAVLITGLLIYFKYRDQKVQIIYFTNEKCIVNYLTDKLVEQAKVDFGNRINARTVVVSLYSGDPPDSPEVKQLREKYQVYGAPMIIINEKEFKKEYKYDPFKTEICKNFIIKPLVCL